MRDALGRTAPPERAQTYTPVAVILHWTIAALIVCNLSIGLLLGRIGLPDRLGVMEVHLALGLSILLLSLIRIAWRLGHRPPPRSRQHAPWERWLAGAVHIAFYAAMLLMPLSGWAVVSANPPSGSDGAKVRAAVQPLVVREILQRHGPLTIAHLIPLPLMRPLAQIGAAPAGLEPQRRLHDRLARSHQLGAFLLIALICLHASGALKHQWADRQPELARMTVRRAVPGKRFLRVRRPSNRRLGRGSSLRQG